MPNNFSSNVEIGKEAPDFELPDINMKIHKLSDYRGQKVVLAFFPAAESPVCTIEMCNFRDNTQGLKEIGTQVIGISVDGPFANKMFSQNRQLNFPLLSDYKRDTISKYGIVMKDLASLKDYNAAKRSIFVLDNNGMVIYKWVSENPMVEPNYDEIRLTLQNRK
jgi:glutaredoxin-dependent peroxiredoxin